MLRIRLVTIGDIETVLALQAGAYHAIEPESGAAFVAKLAASPGTAWLAEEDGSVCGYLFALPWRTDVPPPVLDAREIALPEAPDCLYLHDLAVLGRMRGRGVGGLLVRHALALAAARGLARATLVAIQDSGRFWARHGFFPPRTVPEDIARALAGYGSAAAFLVADLAVLPG